MSNTTIAGIVRQYRLRCAEDSYEEPLYVRLAEQAINKHILEEVLELIGGDKEYSDREYQFGSNDLRATLRQKAKEKWS